jgi:RimJ/RimL family protein N-acetyltransferase
MAIPKTSRLILRPFEAEDLDRLTELMAKSDFMRFSQDPYTREQTQTPLEKFLAWNRAGQPSQFAVLFASDSAFIPITGTRESLPKVRAWCVITRSTN